MGVMLLSPCRGLRVRVLGSCLWAAALGVAALPPGLVRAQAAAETDDGTPDGLTDAQDAEYRQLVADGVAEFGRGNWSEARAFFSRAHALKPSARTLRSLGLVAYELRNYVEAEAFLSGALSEPVHPLTPELRTETEQTLAKARTLIGRFTLRVTPADARVTVDGRPPVLREGVLVLDAGPHQVLAQRAGYLDGELRIDVRGGEEQPLELQLQQAPLAVTSAPAADTSRARVGVDDAAYDRDEDDDGGSVFASPWFWTGVAVLVAGGAATAIVLTADAPDPEPLPPSSGVIYVTLTEAR
jgi:hypothetical protein